MTNPEAARIADLLDRALNGSAWHGPALFEVLDGVSHDAAAARPLPGTHSIWEIAAHVDAWLDMVRQRVERAAPDEVTDEMNWPPVTDASPAAWNTLVSRLRASGDRLRTTIAALSDDRMNEELPGLDGSWSTYLTLHGVVQHVLYHAGQIAIVKRAASTAPA